MPEKGWIRRAWQHVDKRMDSEEFQELDPQMQELLRSFVNFHKNKRGLEGTWIAQELEKAKEKVEKGDDRWNDYASFKGIHTRRQIGVIHLGFTEQATQSHLNAHKYYLEELQRGKDAAMQMALIPKADVIVRGFLRLKSLLNQGDKGAGLTNLTEGLEALERGRDDRALSHFVAFVDGIRNADKDRAAILAEKEMQERKNAALEREIHDALGEIERLEQAQPSPGDPVEEEPGIVSFDAVGPRLAAFRAYLQDKQRGIADLLNAATRHEETMQNFTRRLAEQETEGNSRREEVIRLRRKMAGSTLVSPVADILEIVQQIEKAEDQVKTAEAEREALKREALEFKKTVMNPAYNRWLRETAAGLAFFIKSCGTVEEIFDESAWEGNFAHWEALRPEYARPPTVNDGDVPLPPSAGKEIPLSFLERHRERLAQLPISVLYTRSAYQGNIRRGAIISSELLRGGINAFSVLHVITNSQQENWKEGVEFHLGAIPRARKYAPVCVAGIHSGLLEKNILDEDGNFSFEALHAWIQGLVEASK